MIGEKLKEIRESINMNKKEFAQYLGLKYTTYNNYETEAREPASDFLILISEKFDVSIDYLLGLKEESEILHSYQLKSTEYEYIKKYRTLDPSGQEHVNAVLDHETTRVSQLIRLRSRLAAIVKFPQDPAFDLVLNAAHEDEASTPEERLAGDSIMMDDSEWE